MNKKRTLVSAGVLVLLCLLIYLQVHNWKKFDWATFWNNTSHVNWEFVVLSIAITYSTYWLRAVRWRIFLKPMCQTTTARLLAPQFIGFAGLALLGRPGEMIRPYLIARKEGLTFSSQLAVWAVERIFDVGAFAILLISAIFFAQGPRQFGEYYGKFREGGLLLIALVVGLIITMLVIAKVGDVVAAWVERRFAHHASGLGHKI